MKLIFAIYNVDFAKQLKGNMEADGQAQIIDIVSSEEDLINMIARNPTVSGVLISTDIATKLGNRNLELLVDILLVAREKFPSIVFSVLSSERQGHPVHAELVDMGIYNIFVKDAAKLSIPLLLHSFLEPASFSSVMRHRMVDDSIPWRRSFNRQTTVRVDFRESESIPEAEMEEKKTEVIQPAQLDEKVKKKFHWSESGRDKSKPSVKMEQPQEFIKEWFDDESRVITNDPIIGTVVIALGSVAPHLGTTHTAISIASALKKKGHMVALVEANASQDFDRIHSLFEGENRPILSEPSFEMNGIEHFKYRGEDSMQELYAIYEFLVLDLGNLDLMEFEKEFKRAHVRGVLCSGHEWKFHWIEEFRRKHFNENDIFYLVPHGEPSVVKDLQERIPEVTVLSIPTHTDPYKPSRDAEMFTESLLSGFIKGYGKKFTKSALIGTSVISITLTLIVISAFLIL
ncbi:MULTISPECIES: hypothetical protein [unclassified Sporosarcina]|uniref:hypothetical protein n=1 Tax=unclassified Sporosarcina TaxID=2647733 RepID=UPI001A9193E8|nr:MULTISPECIES: hypothetical protein [unclassified Sporosarcina]MBO0589262.1 hypothetical protein [Sporosarcina sp. E16_8]MBO0601969.1 hypothetical protein [Sporosarcina sp. E16_3]